ncbi:hypothetical protein RZE82_05160 [Mollicutes bacterium LVI A0039]|nr:hypothetical protein RZE82_05160 [Mollicutes bacterium LVI A0039]
MNNKKIILICHGQGEQAFLEGIIHKYVNANSNIYIPVKTIAPDVKLHRTSTQINNLVEVFRKSLLFNMEVINGSSPLFIIMVDIGERDQNKELEDQYISGQMKTKLYSIIDETLEVKEPSILLLYSQKGIENAICEVYPELEEKNGTRHIRKAKSSLSVDLFLKSELSQSNLNRLKPFLDKCIVI